MTRTRRAGTVVALVLATVPLTAVSAAADAVPCVPSVNGKGPTVYVVPDYSDPTKSDVYYESDGIAVEADLCLG